MYQGKVHPSRFVQGRCQDAAPVVPTPRLNRVLNFFEGGYFMDDRIIHECEEQETLGCLLSKLVNHVIDVIVLGGWLYTGKLVEVEDGQVILCDVTVTSCGGMTLSSFEVPKVRICLDTIISAGKPAVCALR
jgi:hypothetical protein